MSILIDQRWRYYEGSAKKFLKHVTKQINRLKKERSENGEDVESKKLKGANVIVNLAAYTAGDQAFILSVFKYSGCSSCDGIMDKLIHSK